MGGWDGSHYVVAWLVSGDGAASRRYCRVDDARRRDCHSIFLRVDRLFDPEPPAFCPHLNLSVFTLLTDLTPKMPPLFFFFFFLIIFLVSKLT